VFHGNESWKEGETLSFYSGAVSSCLLCKDNFMNTNITKHKLWWNYSGEKSVRARERMWLKEVLRDLFKGLP